MSEGGGRYNGSMSDSGGAMESSGAQGQLGMHNNGKTRSYQTVESPTFGHTTRNNQASIVGRNIQLPRDDMPSGNNHWLAPVFGY